MNILSNVIKHAVSKGWEVTFDNVTAKGTDFDAVLNAEILFFHPEKENRIKVWFIGHVSDQGKTRRSFQCAFSDGNGRFDHRRYVQVEELKVALTPGTYRR